MSDHADTETPEAITEQIHAAPLMSEFVVSLPPFGPKDGGLDGSFSRLADLIGAPEEPLSVVVHIADKDQTRSWVLAAAATGCNVTDQVPESPDVELILDEPTWRTIASGDMSLVEAFARGRMRVRGEIEQARRLVQQLRRSSSAG